MSSVIDVYNSRNNLLDILESTGYDTTAYINYGVDQVGSMFETNNLDMTLTHSSGKKVIIKYHIETMKLNVLSDDINQYFENGLLDKTIDNLIIVVRAEPTETMIASLTSLWNASGIFLTVIPLNRLQYNILKHIQVPKHEILSPKEKETLYTDMMIRTDTDLSVISRFDPVATVLCMRPGMVCRITRKSKTAMLTTVYRVCI